MARTNNPATGGIVKYISRSLNCFVACRIVTFFVLCLPGKDGSCTAKLNCTTGKLHSPFWELNVLGKQVDGQGKEGGVALQSIEQIIVMDVHGNEVDSQ